jgi:phosphoribosylanthranilate isomerase
MIAVKICGITTTEDAELCVAAGADAIGLNFYPASPRSIDAERARAIVAAVGGRALTVGVFVDSTEAEIEALRSQTGIDCVQLHGDESPELLTHFLPHAFKALRVRGPKTLELARRFGGRHLLLDAYVPGESGGTGKTFEWSLATELARERHITLAGGLEPGNVAAAIAQVRPFCVDVASGVERAPGCKDAERVHAFIRNAKAAAQ